MWAGILNSSLGYVITIVNYVIRTICIMLIEWVGYASETKKLTVITKFTFYALFFNTAFLLLMVNADMDEQPWNLFLNFGSYGDFNALWWKVIGNTLLSAMFFNAIFPIIEFFLFWAMRFVPRWMDKSYSCF